MTSARGPHEITQADIRPVSFTGLRSAIDAGVHRDGSIRHGSAESGEHEGAAGSMSAVLEVESLRTEFHLRKTKVPAVDGVTFTVGEGECVGLVEGSGYGKRTTGLPIMKLPPNAGHITGGSMLLKGRDLGPLGEGEMRKIRGNEDAMIYQHPMTPLNPAMTIWKQISEAVHLLQMTAQRPGMPS